MTQLRNIHSHEYIIVYKHLNLNVSVLKRFYLKQQTYDNSVTMYILHIYNII